MSSMVSVALLIVGVYLTAYAAGTSGRQLSAAIVGGALLGAYVALNREKR